MALLDRQFVVLHNRAQVAPVLVGTSATGVRGSWWRGERDGGGVGMLLVDGGRETSGGPVCCLADVSKTPLRVFACRHGRFRRFR